MTALDEVGFAAHAREQIRATDVILAKHLDQTTVCSCGRTLPCSQAQSLVRRRLHFVDQLARLDAPSTVGRASVVTM